VKHEHVSKYDEANIAVNAENNFVKKQKILMPK
jgi:hypothetical protein